MLGAHRHGRKAPDRADASLSIEKTERVSAAGPWGDGKTAVRRMEGIGANPYSRPARFSSAMRRRSR